MRAIDTRIGRQCRQLCQRRAHLRGRPFKKPAATGGEECIATKQARRCGITLKLTHIGNVTAGMTGYIDHPECGGWLRERHGSLDALNRAWGTRFAAWDDVVPALTDDALRDEAAVPSWMEFKAWMDAAFARALRAGTAAVHRADPEALAGIEGGQVPGWGGYDYGLISSAVDLMEIYDAGTSLEIAQSLNPDLRTLTVNWKGDADAVRLIWRNWLLGVRGTILWDEEGEDTA